jgi:dUTPase
MTAPTPVIMVELLTECAYMPTRRIMGYDLRSAYDVTIPPWDKDKIKTDLKVYLPSYFMGRIGPCSDWNKCEAVCISTDIVDEYTDNIYVMIWNRNSRSLKIHRGDRIGHIIFETQCQPLMIPISQNLWVKTIVVVLVVVVVVVLVVVLVVVVVGSSINSSSNITCNPRKQIIYTSILFRDCK